jgi:hypothetical protein
MHLIVCTVIAHSSHPARNIVDKILGLNLQIKYSSDKKISLWFLTVFGEQVAPFEGNIWYWIELQRKLLDMFLHHFSARLIVYISLLSGHTSRHCLLVQIVVEIVYAAKSLFHNSSCALANMSLKLNAIASSSRFLSAIYRKAPL